MKKIISAKDVESLLKQGASIESITADAILTPSARDLIRNQQEPHSSSLTPAAGAAVEAAVTAGISAQSSQPELDTFFRTPQMEALKVEICDVGQRLWQRAYVDGNGGNIAIRVADDLALCTPTLVSEGFMKPADLCLVDLDGQQKAGEKAYQRNSHAPGNHETSTARQGDGSLSPAPRNRLRGGWCGTTDLHDT